MKHVLYEVLRRAPGRIGFALIVLTLIFAILGPLVAMDPNKMAIPHRFEGPSLAHLLGTDNLGRDLASRLAQGTRHALVIALVVVTTALGIGAAIGIAAGYVGGWIDRGITTLFDIISAYPTVILAMGVVALYGAGLLTLVSIITLLFIPQFGRMARAQTFSLRHQPFIDAERLLGLSLPRLMLRHILPNIVGPLIVLAGMNLPTVITIEAGLSFVGLGVQPPQASLGSLIKDGYVFLNQSWWPTIGSALTLALVTLGSTLFGEALRDALDPKISGVSR